MVVNDHMSLITFPFHLLHFSRVMKLESNKGQYVGHGLCGIVQMVLDVQKNINQPQASRKAPPNNYPQPPSPSSSWLLLPPFVVVLSGIICQTMPENKHGDNCCFPVYQPHELKNQEDDRSDTYQINNTPKLFIVSHGSSPLFINVKRNISFLLKLRILNYFIFCLLSQPYHGLIRKLSTNYYFANIR